MVLIKAWVSETHSRSGVWAASDGMDAVAGYKGGGM